MDSYLKKRINSFRYAVRGIFFVLREPHFRIHLLALVLVIGLGLFFSISRTEWCAVLLVSSLVLVAEAVNTAIEQLANRVTPDFDSSIGRVKDIAAAAVLIAAIFAVVVGVFVFFPYFF